MNVVFGAFGRTGREVASSLERVGQPVRRVTRSARRGHTGEVAVARLTHEAELGAALRGARAVYAILPDDLRAARFRAERRAMAEALTHAIVRENVPRVVLLSSAVAALGEQGQNGFGVELAYFERLLLETRVPLTILRASYFQDNVADILPRAAQDGVYPNFFASRERPIPTIAACDVGAIAADCLLEAPTSAREIVDLSGPSYSPLDMARIASEALGRPLTVLDVPAAAREHAFGHWMSPEAARAMVETIDCIGSARAEAPGDRARRGATPLRQVLLASLAQGASVAQEVRP